MKLERLFKTLWGYSTWRRPDGARWGEELLVEIINVCSCLHSFITSCECKKEKNGTERRISKWIGELMRWTQPTGAMKTRTFWWRRRRRATTSRKQSDDENENEPKWNWVKILNHRLSAAHCPFRTLMCPMCFYFFIFRYFFLHVASTIVVGAARTTRKITFCLAPVRVDVHSSLHFMCLLVIFSSVFFVVVSWHGQSQRRVREKCEQRPKWQRRKMILKLNM